MDGVAIWQFTDNYRGLNVDGNITLIDLKISSGSSQSKSTKTTAESLSQHPVVKWNIALLLWYQMPRVHMSTPVPNLISEKATS